MREVNKMSKTRQVMKICENGKKFSIVYHEDDKMNPFWVYRHTWGLRQCGYGCAEHKRIEIKYADIQSCLYYLVRAI